MGMTKCLGTTFLYGTLVTVLSCSKLSQVSGNGSAALAEGATSVTKSTSSGTVTQTLSLQFSSFSPASPSNSTSPKIKGLSVKASQIKIYNNAQCSGTPVVGTAAVFASSGLTLSATLNSSNPFYGIAVASDGSSTACTFLASFVHDSVAPVVDIDSAPDIFSSNLSSYTASGSCSEDGRSVTISVDSNDFVVTCSSGSWTLSAEDLSSLGLSDGGLTLSVSQTDAAGNTGSASVNITMDTDAGGSGVAFPAIAFLSPASSPSTDTTPSFRISWSDGRQFENSSTVKIYTAAACAGSSTSVSVNAPATNYDYTSGVLSDGSHVFSASISDVNGNQICSSSNSNNTQKKVTYVLDTLAPSVALNTPLTVVNAANEGAWTVSGTCSEANRSVSIGVDDGVHTEIASTATCSSGTWSVILDLQSLDPGSLTVSVGHLDAAGNNATDSAAVTHDASAPSTTIGSSPAITNSNKSSYTTSGSCTTADGNVSVTIGSFTAVSVSCSASAWTHTADVSSLSDGTVAISVSQTDTVGNTGSDSANVNKDVGAPVVAISTSPDISASNKSSYTTSGSCTTADGNVSVTIGSLTAVSVSCSASAWTHTADVSSLADGSVAISVSQTDTVGNTGSDSANVNKDTVPALAYPVIQRNVPSTEYGNDSTPTFTASLEDASNFLSGDVIKLYHTSCTGTLLDTVTGSTATSLDVTASSVTAHASGNAANNFYVTVTRSGVTKCSGDDPSNDGQGAGSLGDDYAVYVFDNTSPATPGIALNGGFSTPSTSANFTADITLTGGGQFVSGDILEIFLGNACTGTADATATSSGSVTTDSVAFTVSGEGSVTVWARVVDAAGNASACSSSHASLQSIDVVYDNTAPTWSGDSVSTATASHYSLSDSPSISYTANASDATSGIARYEYSIGTSAGAQDVVDWTTAPTSGFQVTGMSLTASNVYYITMRAVDNVGLSNGATTQRHSWTALNADTQKPGVTIALKSGQASSASSLPIEYTVTFTEAINNSTFVVGDITSGGTSGSVSWSITNSGDDTVYTLAATSVASAGTVIPSLSAGVIADPSGNTNTASNTDATVTYTPGARVAYLSTTGNDGTGTIDDVSKPFRTAQAVVDAVIAANPTVSAPITINVASGTAVDYGNVTLTQSFGDYVTWVGSGYGVSEIGNIIANGAAGANGADSNPGNQYEPDPINNPGHMECENPVPNGTSGSAGGAGYTIKLSGESGNGTVSFGQVKANGGAGGSGGIGNTDCFGSTAGASAGDGGAGGAGGQVYLTDVKVASVEARAGAGGTPGYSNSTSSYNGSSTGGAAGTVYATNSIVTSNVDVSGGNGDVVGAEILINPTSGGTIYLDGSVVQGQCISPGGGDEGNSGLICSSGGNVYAKNSSSCNTIDLSSPSTVAGSCGVSTDYQEYGTYCDSDESLGIVDNSNHSDNSVNSSNGLEVFLPPTYPHRATMLATKHSVYDPSIYTLVHNGTPIASLQLSGSHGAGESFESGVAGTYNIGDWIDFEASLSACSAVGWEVTGTRSMQVSP